MTTARSARDQSGRDPRPPVICHAPTILWPIDPQLYYLLTHVALNMDDPMSRSAVDVKFERGEQRSSQDLHACKHTLFKQEDRRASKSPAPDTLYGSFGIEI